MFKRETLNATKLHFVLLNVTTKALHLNLQEEIQSRNPCRDSVQNFLQSKYNDLRRNYPRRNQLPTHLKGFIQILNPNYPNSAPSFPNDLKQFDISSCFQIAQMIFPGISPQDPRLRDYDDLRIIRNECYGHLVTLKIDDTKYNEKMTRLKEITASFSTDAAFKRENLKKIERIENFVDIIYSKN